MITQTFKGHAKENTANFKATWYSTHDFSKINPINQVYGVCFDKNGKIALVLFKRWSLPGGTPEKRETPEETLIREVDEEASLDLQDIRPLGYQKIENLDNGDIFYQLRYFAKVKKIKTQTIDPANGKINRREFVSPKDFSKYCSWGNVGEEVVRLAKKIFDQGN